MPTRDAVPVLARPGAWIALLAVLSLLLSAPVVGQNQDPADATGQEAVADDYRVGARDLLEVRVFDLEDLNSEVRVSEAGTISLPLIGEMQVGGLSRNALEDRIEEALSRYVNDPQVFVFVKEFQSQRFAIMGAVNTPGTYPMEGRTTLLEAISQAGGINFETAAGTIAVIRQGFTQEPIEIDLNELLEQGNTAYNIVLEPSDVVNVEPKRSYTIFVYGQVNSPGSFQLREPITLLQAISLAGGLADRAAADRVRIMRKLESGRQEIIEVNLDKIEDGEEPDVQVRAGDVILVPATFF